MPPAPDSGQVEAQTAPQDHCHVSPALQVPIPAPAPPASAVK